jgi:putative glycosyltransferase (TIGR04372 family)
MATNAPVKWSKSPGRNYGVWQRLKRSKIIWPLLNRLFSLVERVVSPLYELIERRILYKKTRFLLIPTEHIGHLAIEVDSFLKEGILERRPSLRAVVLASDRVVANPHLARYFKQRLTVITNPWTCAMLKPFAKMKALHYDVVPYAQIENDTSTAPAINRDWGSRPPLWTLSNGDLRRGMNTLRSLGLPEGAWFVCVHCREFGYLAWNRHNFRDVDVSNYILAMQAIVEKGGWCFRMGDPTMKPLPKIEGVIDYCHHSVRSDWMDVFLCGCCRFFLGSGSGLSWISSIFGVPVASANCAPVSTVLAYRPGDIGIPKLVWSEAENRYLTFGELMSVPLGDVRRSHFFEEARVRLVQNSPDEIAAFALEMLDRTEGKAEYTRDDKILQARFRSLMRPGHFAYGSGSGVGRDFLRKYRELLPEENSGQRQAASLG